MGKVKKVILLLDLARSIDRELARGIARFSRLHTHWAFYSNPLLPNLPLPTLENWDADGIIANSPTDQATKILKRLGKPVVTRGKFVEGCSRIVSDSVAIARMAASHFIEKGFQKFAYCGYESVLWSERREAEFGSAIFEHGYTVSSYKAKGQLSPDAEMKLLAEWLSTLERPTALFVCNDDRARDIIRAAKIAEVKIPEDIALLGVDNDEHICELSDPPLSSIQINSELVGYKAAELLNNMISGLEVGEKEIVVRPNYVVTRQSSDTLAIDDIEVAKAIGFIKKHSKRVVQVDDVVDSTSLSRRVLEKRFRTILNRSILEEIRGMQAQKISELLTETNMSINQIAIQFGYSSSKHIARFFREIVGVTPSEFRKINNRIE